jgi:hypothetical protein
MVLLTMLLGKKTFLELSKVGGRVVEPSLHMRKRRRLVHKSLETLKGRSHVQSSPTRTLTTSHKTTWVVTKAFNIQWPSLVKTKVLTHVRPLDFQDIKNLWK